jgi:hypothetical protein
MSHIFISYSKANIPFAHYLRATLEAEGLPVWMDETQLNPSTRWWKEIEDSITAAAAVIIIMSPEAAASDWVEREILLAEKLKRPLFPVLLTGEPWSRLANLQFEDMRAGLRAKPSTRLLTSLQTKLGLAAPVAPGVTLELVEGDILTHPGDVAILKFSRSHLGAAAAVAHRLIMNTGITTDQISPERGQAVLVPTQASLTVPQVMYVGSPQIRHFGYNAVQEFARNTLLRLAEQAPDARHILMTFNGPGTSLDENEAFLFQLRGYLESLEAGAYPPTLERITIVERDQSRHARMQAFLTEQVLTLPEFTERVLAFGPPGHCRLVVQNRLPAPTPPIPDKPHAFVILSQTLDLEDAFYYGIQSPLHARGLLCERIENTFTDDLIDQAKARIRTARVVVAEVSVVDPLVHLLVGYAWGCDRPLILVQRTGQPAPLGMTPSTYTGIKSLEHLITTALDTQ